MNTLVICLVLHHSLVLGAPQNRVGTFSSFSNFHPASQTLRAGSHTQLSQSVSSQDTFFQSLDYGLGSLFNTESLGFGGTGLEGFGIDTGSFDAFSATSGMWDLKYIPDYRYMKQSYPDLAGGKLTRPTERIDYSFFKDMFSFLHFHLLNLQLIKAEYYQDTE